MPSSVQAAATSGKFFMYGALPMHLLNAIVWLYEAVKGPLALTLFRERDSAFLFRDLATLRSHLELFDSVDDLYWNGPTPAFAPLAERLDAFMSTLAPRS